MNNKEIKERIRKNLITKAVEDGWKYLAVKIEDKGYKVEGTAEGMNDKNFEKFMYKLFVVAIIGLVVLVVFSETTLAQVNVDVQRVEKEVLEQKKKIDSLEMKIDEMTSLDHIKEISLEYGLSYHSENIRTIE